ncbi:RNA-directed DNA polymerase, eukaryota [Tanacetum coccineum]
MAIGTGHRSNNYSESKRNDHLDNNRRQEQRNKGIPNKSHPNFREEHKSFSSIFVSNIPWNASVQDLWDICNKWSVSFNSYAKAVLGNKSVDMSGKYGTCNAGAESVGGGRIVTRASKTYVFWDSMMLSRLCWGNDGFWLEFDSIDQVESVKILQMQPGGSAIALWAPAVYKEVLGSFVDSLHRVIESFRVSYRNRTYRIIATEFAYWAPNIESMEVNSESNPLERKDAEDSPKNVNNDSVSPSSRVLREEDVRGVESDLVDSFEEGEIRDDSVLYNDGCIKDCMENNLEDDAGEILGVHSQGDCGNVTTMK